ncbi:MAG TPA: 2-dehydropantoate 2-reductase [Labilithrix sp.]|nr:2-dehydropantoate 2-reductase [Labilithrix sp.]
MVAIAIVGPGAVGGSVAAELARDPVHEVTVCARTAFDHLEVETPTGTLIATPRVLTDPAQAMPVDWVLIATKTYDHAATGVWLRSLVAARTRVAILQNGVEHVERFSPYVAAASIVPVVVDCPAERSRPGRVRVRRTASLLVPDTRDGHAFVALFAHTEVLASTVSDFKTELWRKLCVNCAGAVSAILLQPPRLSKRAALADLMREIAMECRAVGLAEGAVLGEDVVEGAVTRYRDSASVAINSLHADRLAGRPMEVDARNGVVVRLGIKHGIATPLNKAVVALLDAAQPE